MSEPMDEDELVAILRAEEVDASGFYTSEIASDQATAMDRYYAALYGDEKEGRSKITTHDIQDTVNWMMPTLLRLFFGADELVSCDPESESDEANCQPAASYLEHILLRDNPGTSIIHDFCFDGLVQRIGYVSVMWEDPKPGALRRFTGMSADQLIKMETDPSWRIESAAQDGEVDADGDDDNEQAEPQGEQAAEAGQQQPTPAAPTYSIEARKINKIGRVRIEAIPPEEVALSRRSRSVDTADYLRRKRERYLADIIKENPEKRHDLENGGGGTSREADADTDPRSLSRFQNESVALGNEGTKTGSRRKIDYLTEWLWCDFDGDGVVELRRIERVGNVVLSNDAVDRCELVAWSPIRVAHKAIGLSIADTIIDLQKIRTVITRKILDSLSQSLTPRNVINMQMCDEQAVDDLLDAIIGGAVRVNGDARAALTPITTPDVTPSGMQALEYFDQKSEQASGVTRHSQGLQPDAITKTAAGIENLQAAAGERVELVANWLGLGVEQILQRALSLIVAHQDGERWLKLNGKPTVIDPRFWSDDMAIKVHVGKVGSSRTQQLQSLNAVAAKQEQAIQIGGLDNPVCDVPRYLNTLSRMTEAMGFKDASKFWKTDDEAQQFMQQKAQQPPAPDPKMAEVQQKGEIAQAEMAAKVKASEADMAAKNSLAQQEAANEHALQMAKINADATNQERSAKAEMDLAQQRMALEERLEMLRIDREERLERYKIDTNARAQIEVGRHKAGAAVDIAAAKNDGIKDMRSGGKLDA